MNIFMQPRNSQRFDNVTLTPENVPVKQTCWLINTFTSFLLSSTELCDDALCTNARHEMSPGTNSWTKKHQFSQMYAR